MKRFFCMMLVYVCLFLVLTSSYAVADSEIELEKIVVTPTRMSQYDYNKTASNVTVIGRDKIEASNAEYVADILREEAGIHYYDNSTAKTATVDIRGFGDTAGRNVLLLVDGRKVNPVDISGPDWIQVPLESVERIEVLRGAASVMYGDNAVGGVINIITKKGKGVLSGSASASLGSYSTEKTDVQISGAQDKVSYYLYSKYYDTDGYRSNSSVFTKDWDARVGYDFLEDLSIDLSAGWHEDDYGMPGGLNDQGELTQYGRRGSPDENDSASTKDRFVRLALDAKPWFDVTDSTSFNFDISYRNRDSYSWLNYGGWPTATKYQIDTVGATAKYVYEGYIADSIFNFVAGVDYYDTEHIILGSEMGTDDITIYKEEMGFYGYLEHQMIGDVVANVGARYQTAKYRFDQRKSTKRYEIKEPNEFVLMGGAKYQYSDDSTFHFSVNETFRFLATDEWYSTWSGLNTNLQHQTGIQYEAGVRHNFDDILIFTLTPYFINMKDEIYVNPYPSPGQNENYPKTHRKGVEVGLNADLSRYIDLPYLDQVNLYTNYTLQQAKFKDGDYGSNDIPMAPRHQANAGLDVDIHDDYNLSLIGKYVGERYAINDTRNETPRMKDYFVLDGKLAYAKGQFEFYAAINNILNREYFNYVAKSSSSTLKDHYPAPERNFEIGARYTF